VHGVLANAARVELADGAGLGLRRVRCAHGGAVLEHRVFALEDGHDDRRALHELHQLAEEGPSLVHGVETLGNGLGHVELAQANDAEALLLEEREDGASLLLFDGVRLDDAEGAFDGHGETSLGVVRGRDHGGVGQAARDVVYARRHHPKRGKLQGLRAYPAQPAPPGEAGLRKRHDHA